VVVTALLLTQSQNALLDGDAVAFHFMRVCRAPLQETWGPETKAHAPAADSNTRSDVGGAERMKRRTKKSRKVSPIQMKNSNT
jgi:hypothetical protein